MKTRWIVLIAIAVIGGVVGIAAREPLMEWMMIQRIDQTLQRANNSLLTDGQMHVILCGTATALPDPDRAAACTAIIVNGEFWLVDVGPGSWRNVDVLNLPISKLSGVLITHFHSDHIGELGEAITQSWIAGRTQPLDVYGPTGLNTVLDGFHQAYSLDETYRVLHHGEDYMPAAGDAAVAHELPTPEGVQSEVVLERNGLRISAFRVDHAPVDPAFGYRFEYRGRVVVISGDTMKSQSVTHNAQNADILLHEGLAKAMTDRASARAKLLGMTRLAKLAIDVSGYHTTPVEAAEVAAAAQVHKLVFTHIFPPLPNAMARHLYLEGTADAYKGPIVLGTDGMRFDLAPAN